MNAVEEYIQKVIATEEECDADCGCPNSWHTRQIRALAAMLRRCMEQRDDALKREYMMTRPKCGFDSMIVRRNAALLAAAKDVK